MKYYQLKNQTGGMVPGSSAAVSGAAAVYVAPPLPQEVMTLVLENGNISLERLLNFKRTSPNPLMTTAIDRYIHYLVEDGNISMYNLLILIASESNNIPLVTRAIALFLSKYEKGEQLSVSELLEFYKTSVPPIRPILERIIDDAYFSKSEDMRDNYDPSLSPNIKLKHLIILFSCDVLTQLQQPRRRYHLLVTFGQPPNQIKFIYDNGIYNTIQKNRVGGRPNEYNADTGGFFFNKLDLFTLIANDVQAYALPLSSIKVEHQSVFNPNPRVLFDFNFM
jgi:hypothetical protein